MRFRRSLLVLAALFSTTARADDHKWSVFAAASYAKNQNSTAGNASIWNGGLSSRQGDFPGSGFGWHVTADIAVVNKFDRRLSFAADMSGHFVGPDRMRDATQFSLMVGPQWALGTFSKAHTFVHAMVFGVMHRSDSRLNLATSTLTAAVGAGADIIPAENGNAGVRIQLDWILPLGTNAEKSWRYSAGLIYRFGVDPDED